ncbi:MAG: DoxX family protein [Actinomycetota bacterium]
MRAEAELRRVGPAVVRITAGLLWFVNVDWKVPPDFGRAAGRGLARFVQLGIDHPVLPPYSWFLEHVVLPNLTAFGWLTLLIESSLAALLISGAFTRLAAIGGAAQSAAIALTVMNAPGEWYWSYLLMMAVHLAVFAIAAGGVWGVDAIRAKAGRVASAREAEPGRMTQGLEVSVRRGKKAVAAALVAYGAILIVLQRDQPLLTAAYPDSGYALFHGTVALGLVLVGLGAVVGVTGGRPSSRVAAGGFLLVAVAAFVTYRSPVNIFSATPSTAAILAGAAVFLVASGYPLRDPARASSGPA